MLPAWLGAGTALQKVVEDGKQSELEAMCRDWPFFSTRLGMLEMVFAKADLWLAEYYDQRLVDKALWPLGKELRNLQEEDIKVVLAIANDSHLMADLPWIAGVYSATEYLHRPAERIAGRVTAPLPPGRKRRPGTGSSRRTSVNGHYCRDCGRYA